MLASLLPTELPHSLLLALAGAEMLVLTPPFSKWGDSLTGVMLQVHICTESQSRLPLGQLRTGSGSIFSREWVLSLSQLNPFTKDPDLGGNFLESC